MTFTVITLFPELIESFKKDALVSRAIKNNLLKIDILDLRNFSDNSYRSVDDTPYGGGDGMLIRPDILESALLSLSYSREKHLVIYLSPQGSLLDYSLAKRLAVGEKIERNVVLICGRYAGIDQRFIDQYVEAEVSIGNYILSGGELAALVLIESASRYIPGVLGNAISSKEDSLENGWLEAPQYTRPPSWNGRMVPEVLMSGHHQKIEAWKNFMSQEVTKLKRPDLAERAEKGKKSGGV